MSRRRIGQLLLVAGMLSLVAGAWAGAQYRAATARGGAFFVDPFGLAADDAGRVFVGIDRRHVHGYDAEGRAVAAWTVDVDAGRFRLRVAAPERIEVALDEAGELRTYALDGSLLSQERDPDAFARFGPANDVRTVAPTGEVFELRDEGLVRAEPAPATVLVYVPPWPLAMMGTRPAQLLFLLLLCGTVGLLVGAVMTAMRPAEV